MISTDLTNVRFGRLLALSRGEPTNYGKLTWNCICDCGNTVIVPRCSLVSKIGTKSCGCLGREKKSESSKRLAKNLLCQKFGRLTVLKRDDSTRNDTAAHWLCQCDCGVQKIVKGPSLLRKKNPTISCGCYSREQASLRGKELNTLPLGQATLNALWYHYQYNAKKRKLLFEIDYDLFIKLINGNCYYCDAGPGSRYRSRSGNGDTIYNGIDRKNNSIGYIDDNCVSCCGTCNKAKMTMNSEDFIELAKRVAVKHFK